MDPSMEQKITDIKGYYEKKVSDNKGASTSSMPDAILIEREIELISTRIEEGERILDVGCANGYSVMRYAKDKACYLKGIDYSESMIKNAKEEYGKIKGKIKQEIEFEVGDARDIKEKDNSFDKVIAKRCVINLPTWDLQKLALSQMTRVLKKGGKLLLSEASKQGWENMNKLRLEFGLKEIKQPWFNLYLDDTKLCDFLEKNNLEKIEVINFSSTYYIGSRVIQPFVIGKDKEPRYDSEINRLFSFLPNYGDYGTQKFYSFIKKK